MKISQKQFLRLLGILLSFFRKSEPIQISSKDGENQQKLKNKNTKKAAKGIIAIIVPAIAIYAYSRNDYKHWIDEDKDCQDTRQEVLIEESLEKVTLDEKGCRVLKGKWYDPYTDRFFTNPGDLDIDHFIPLKEVHLSGGQYWDKKRKMEYANDLDNAVTLIAVYKGANRSKGARDPSEWMPKNTEYHCEYLKVWQDVKNKWELGMDEKEKRFIEDEIKKCE